MNFTNSQIYSDTLPSIEDVVLKPISKQYIKIILIHKFLMYAIFFAMLIFGRFFAQNQVFQDYFWLLLLIVCLFCAANLTVALLAFRTYKYAIREHDIIYAQGLIFRSITTVPIVRIQHIEESRSWLSRQFDLATLNIYTAGASGSDLIIKGLEHQEARRINDFISGRINGDKSIF